MASDRKIFALTGNLGYGGFDRIIEDFPDRYIDCGAAEQAMVDIAVGMALSGKKPVIYSITPFLLYRPFESVRNYLSREKIPVILIGSGRDRDYDTLGFGHWAEEDAKIMSVLPNIDCYWPNEKEELNGLLNKMIKSKKASYLNLTR